MRLSVGLRHEDDREKTLNGQFFVQHPANRLCLYMAVVRALDVVQEVNDHVRRGLRNDELDQVAEIQSTLRTFVGEAVANFTIGNRNIETEWETYLGELEAIGLAQYLEVSQTAYDRMK